MAPLTPAVLHILLSLAAGDRHGYGILKDVLAQTDQKVRLGPGTLYGTLQRLMASGWVDEVAAPRGSLDERRRFYRLTRAGRSALQAEVDRLELPHELSHRLMEMGFLPGMQVTAARCAPGGDPRVFRLDGTEIALRRDTAACVFLKM